MRVILIKPRLSGKRPELYLAPVKMEPLTMAVIAGLLPSDTEIFFYDDRFEAIPFDKQADWVGITADTYTAKRAYEISAEFRKRGISVVLEGYHPTLMPEEACEHADSLVIGEAENIMNELVEDIRLGRLKKRYRSDKPADLNRVRPQRSIFKGKPYPRVNAVEFGRGCKYRCEFCSIHKFNRGPSRSRSVESIVEEIKRLSGKVIMFVDDNLVNNSKKAKELFRALIPLRIHWGSQVSIDAGLDEEMFDLMRESGCMTLMIGLESLNDESLSAMRKKATAKLYRTALRNIRDRGITVNGSFVWGYDGDTKETLEQQYIFSMEQKFILAGFNHLMPCPGTDIKFNTNYHIRPFLSGR